MAVDNSIVKKIVVARYSDVVAYPENQSYNQIVTRGVNIELGIATGEYDVKNGQRAIQFYPTGVFDGTFFWVNEQAIFYRTESTTGTSQQQAIDLVQGLLENNFKVMSNCLAAAGLIKNLRAKGVNTAAYEQKLSVLYYRCKGRNQKVQDCPYISNKKQGTDRAITSLYSSELNRIVTQKIAGTPRVGELVTLTVLLIGFAIGGVVVWLVYRAFKNTYSDSKADLTISDDLKLALAKLDPETKQRVLTDLESQVDAAYAQGVMDSNSDSFLGKLKTWGTVGLAIVGVMWIKGEVDIQGAKKRLYGK